jgi:hypothetical protein
MSKLARALTLVAMLAAMNLAGMTAVAQAHATDQPSGQADPTVRRLLAQERYYSTWGYGDTSAPAPPEPSGQAGWLTPAPGVLAGVLALVAGVAVVAARRAYLMHSSTSFRVVQRGFVAAHRSEAGQRRQQGIVPVRA